VVPRLAGRFLIVPNVGAGVGVQLEHRREEQIVALAFGALPAAPRRTVARADVDLIELLVVDDRVPRRAAAAVLVVLVAEPGRSSELFDRIIGCGAVGSLREI